MKARELTQELRLELDGHILSVPDAPLSYCRHNRGISRLLERIVLTRDVQLSWSQFRRLAIQHGTIVDPRDDLADATADAETSLHYRGPGERIAGSMRGAGR